MMISTPPSTLRVQKGYFLLEIMLKEGANGDMTKNHGDKENMCLLACLKILINSPLRYENQLEFCA